MLSKAELIVNCCCQIVPASLRLAKSSIDIIACLGYLPLFADFIKHLQGRSSLPNTVIEGGKIITCMPNFRHEAATFVEQLHCTAAERELIYHGNAERLLGLT